MAESVHVAERGEGRVLSSFMTPLGAWAYGVGCAIGWGSFVVTTNQYLLAGGPLSSVVGMLFGLAVMLVIARNYAYLMQRYPSVGGAYTYARHILGHDYGFLVAWFLGLTYLSVFWANATSLPLFASFFMGDTFRVGFLHTVFGYDVYLGECALTMVAIATIGLLCMGSKRFRERIMIALALLFTVGIGICFLAGLVLPTAGTYHMDPLVLADKGVYDQLLGITLMTPWAFIGFESISHSSEEFSFPRERSGRILVAIAVATTLLYIMVIILSVSAYPPAYDSWFAYLSDLGNLSGIEALPPFYAAYAHMGQSGVVILMLSLLALILTSFIGNIVALSRLLVALARDGIAWADLASLNRHGVPYRAVQAIVGVSLLVPLMGRTAIGWIVDITTIGAVIVYGIVSNSARRLAQQEGDQAMCRSGAAGLGLMLGFGAVSLLPSLFNEGSLAQETYFLVTAWSILGFMYYRLILRNDGREWFGRSIVVWAFLLSLVFFSSTVWLQKSDQRVMDDAINDISAHIITRDERQRAYVQETLKQANKVNERNSLMITGIFVLALGMILGDYRYVRKRQVQSDRELGVVREVAYTDRLTGVKSKNAFAEWEERIDERIARRAVESLAVAVCDVNGLKRINDTLGHKAGDECIVEAARLVCVHFAHSPVFRIGGDEFVAILEGSDFERRAEILAAFDREAERRVGSGQVVVSVGISDYEPDADYSFSSVFNRADELMYRHKHELKTMEG